MKICFSKNSFAHNIKLITSCTVLRLCCVLMEIENEYRRISAQVSFNCQIQLEFKKI